MVKGIGIMWLEQLSYAAQIIGSIGGVISLIFVGFQIRHNTAQLQRGEHNSTMEQWSNIRRVIAENTDIAAIWSAGLAGERPLTPPELLRMESLMAEYTWATFHIWDRGQRGVFPKDHFVTTAVAPTLRPIFASKVGGEWWARAKAGFPPGFAQHVDAALARLAGVAPAAE